MNAEPRWQDPPRYRGSAATAGFVAALSRAYVRGENPPSPDPQIDWDRVNRFCAIHSLTPTLAPLLQQMELPENFREALERHALGLRRRSALLWLEMGRLLPALHRAGIDGVVLKGLALGLTHYRSPQERFVSDLDLLVSPDQLQAAERVLAAEGYWLARTQRHTSFYREHHFHLIFSNSLGTTLELHWNLSRPTDYFQFDVEGFLGRSRLVVKEGLDVRIPSDVDQLLHAACQALREGFADLRRTVDAALLVGAGVTADPRLVDLARSQGMSAAVWTLLELQRSITGVEFPPSVDAEFRPRPGIRRCLESLSLGERVLSLDARRLAGFKVLLSSLCAPTPAAAAACIGRFVIPGKGQLLDAGFLPESFPSYFERSSIAAKHAWSLIKIAGFQARCLGGQRRAG